MSSCRFSDSFGSVSVVDVFGVEVVEWDFVEALRMENRRKGVSDERGRGEERRGRGRRTAPGPQTQRRVPLGAIGGRQGAKRVSSKGRSLKMWESQNAAKENERKVVSSRFEEVEAKGELTDR